MQDHTHVIGEFLVNGKDRIEKLLGVKNPVQFGPELPVDFLGLNDFQAYSLDTVFNAAVKTLPYWVYLIGDKDADPAGMVDVGLIVGDYKVASISMSEERATRILLAVWELQDHAASNGLPENIRILRIPGLSVDAVWNQTGDGYFIPVLSFPKMPIKVMDRNTFHNFLKNPPPSGNVCPMPSRP